MSEISVERAHELIDQIFEPGDLDEAMNRIEYLKECLNEIWGRYDEENKAHTNYVDKIIVYWHDILNEWAIKIEYTNGTSEFPSITPSGVSYNHTLLKAPKHYKRMSIIGWIVLLGRTRGYTASELAIDLYIFLSEKRTPSSVSVAWQFLSYLPPRYFDRAEAWLIRKENA